MGAESSSLQNCQLEEALQVSSDREWQIHPGRTGDKSAVSVFVYKNAVQNKDLIENAAKNLKILRHPCIVKFLGWTKSNDGHRLITEPVTPLELQLDSLTSLEICAGLHDVAQALSFLHDRGGFCHNNVSISTIFVSDDGSWKLGCMEHVCRYEDVTLDKLKKFAPTRDSQTISPEEKSGKLIGGRDAGHARDAYAFGIVVEQLDEYINNLGSEAEWFQGRVHEELLQDDPTLRPKLRTLLLDPIFQIDFLSILNFLKNITVKSEAEKKTFFESVVEKLHNLPAELVARRLTRLLLSRFVLLDTTADKELVPHFLHPCEGKRSFQGDSISPVLPKGLFQKFVIPELFKIFHVRDCHVRLVILKQFAAYVSLFDKSTLQTVILPQVIVGLRDSHDDLVSASLHALAEMVPILGSEVVIGSNRHSIFKEGKPKFKIMNGSAINHVDKYIEHTPNMIAGVLPFASANDAAPPIKAAAKTLKDQAKEADKQKRRDEARKRMEERRKKREERKIVKGNDGYAEAEDPSADLKSKWPQDDTINTQVDTSQHDDEHVLSDSAEEEEEEDDIDKEIENEIMSMDSTLSLKEMNRIKALNEAQVVDSSLKVTVDWSDISDSRQPDTKREISKKGVLKLKASSAKHEVEEKSVNSPNVDSWGDSEETWGDDDWGTIDTASKHTNETNINSSFLDSRGDGGDSSWGRDNWGDDLASQTSPNERYQGDNIIEGKTESNVKMKTQVQKHPLKKSELGSEFDIKSISIKKKEETTSGEETLDFFADMEPVIKATSLTNQASVSKKEESKSKLTFEVLLDNTSEADGGWEDDLEWGEEENWS